MLTLLDVLVLITCVIPVLAGPVPQPANDPVEAAADVRPSAYYIAPSVTSLLASIYEAASSAESADTCSDMFTTASGPANHAVATATFTTDSLFSYVPQFTDTTASSLSTQPVSHPSARRTTTLTEFTTILPTYGQVTSSSLDSSSDGAVASTTASMLQSYSTVVASSIPSAGETPDVANSASATQYGSTSSSIRLPLVYGSIPSSYFMPTNTSVTTSPTQSVTAYSTASMEASLSYPAVTLSSEASPTGASTSMAQYGGNTAASSSSEASPTDESSSNDTPLVYGSLTLTYSIPTESSIFIKPSQYVSMYPTSSEAATETHRRTHEHLSTASPSSTESTTAFSFPPTSSGSAVFSLSATSMIPSSSFHATSYEPIIPTTAESSTPASTSEAPITIIPILPSAYAFDHESMAAAESLKSVRAPDQPLVHAAATAGSLSRLPGISIAPINPDVTTVYVTIMTTDAGATATKYVTVSSCA